MASLDSQDLKLHVVLDNDGTNKHPRVQNWLKRHRRFIPHFIPTSSSWLNLVERWFGELTGKRVRRGVFVSVEDLSGSVTSPANRQVSCYACCKK